MLSTILKVIGLLVTLLFPLLARGLSWFPGGRRRAMRNWQWVLQNIASHRNGTVASGSWHRISCLFPDGDVTVRIHGSHSHLKIRLRRPLPFAASLYHIPRLLYAFAEAFLSPELRMEGLPYFILPGRGAEKLVDLKGSPSFRNLLGQFASQGFSIHVDEEGLSLSKRVRNRRIEEAPYLELLDAAGEFALLCAAPLAKIPVHEVQSDPHCAYCKESILDGAAVSFCGSCNTPHHRECFELNSGCSVFGCRSRQQIPTPQTIRI